jgi:hypothetical protein
MRDERGRFLPGNPSRWIPRTEPLPDRLKQCTTCQDWLPVGCFTRDPSAPDGRERWCKACRYERRAALARGAKQRKPWGLRFLR